MNSQSDIVEAIDALLKFIRSCGAYRDVQEIPPDSLAEFYRLDQRVYDLAKSAGQLDRLPDRSALDREWNVDGTSVPVRFEGKTNLPADWDNNALMVYAKGGWTADMLALRTLASIGLVPALPSSPAKPDPNPVPSPEGGKPPKKPTVNDRMAAMLMKDPSRVEWSAQKWAVMLGCTKAAVLGTDTWKKIMTTRKLQQADRASRRR